MSHPLNSNRVEHPEVMYVGETLYYTTKSTAATQMLVYTQVLQLCGHFGKAFSACVYKMAYICLVVMLLHTQLYGHSAYDSVCHFHWVQMSEGPLYVYSFAYTYDELNIIEHDCTYTPTPISRSGPKERGILCRVLFFTSLDRTLWNYWKV